MAYRIVTPLAVYLSNTGEVLAGGELRFYEPGTTTAKSVYSDDDLSVNLGNEITLDSAGRAPTDIWGSGEYRVRLYDEDGNLIDEADPVTDPAGSDTSLPSQTGHSGKFLTTNGVSPSWDTIRQVPDPTGNSGKVLTNDGTNTSWATVPGLPTDGVSQDTTSVTVGKMKFVMGTSTAPSSGTHTTSIAVTFGVTYASAPKVFVSPKENVITSSGFSPVVAVKSITTTGCTIHVDVNEAESTSSYNINTSVPLDWMAVGLIP